MGFKGDLTTFNLANIFQTLSMNRQTGTLSIFNEEEASEANVYFQEGTIRQVSTSDSRKLRLGEVLLRMRLISAEELEQALATQRTTREKLGDILVRSGFISEEKITDALRFQQEETIYELFTWDGALFEFIDDHMPEDAFSKEVFDLGITLNTNSVMMEAMRRLDEWNRIRNFLPTELEIPVQISKPDNPEYDEKHNAIFELVNGINSARKIFTLSYLGKFTTFQTLAELIRDGHVRIKDLSELIQTGNECLKSGYYEESIAILKLVLEKDYWSPDVVTNLVEAYLAIGDRDEAVARLRELVEHYRREGELDMAIERCANIVEVLPEDANEHVALATLYLEAGKKNRAVEEFRLAQKKINQKEDPDTYIRVSEEILKNSETDVKVRENLISLLISDRRLDDALGHLSKLALLYSGQGRYKAAIEVYHRMVKLAPNKSEYRQKLERLVDLEGKRQTRRLKVVRLCILLVLLLSIGGISLGYFVHARMEFQTVVESADREAEHGNFAAAHTLIQEYNDKFPFGDLFNDVSGKISEYSKLEKDALRERKKKDDIRKKTAIADAREFLEKIPSDESEIAVEKMFRRLEELREGPSYPEKEDYLDQAERKLAAVRDKIESLLASARELINKQEYDQAHIMLVGLAKKFPKSEAVMNASVPVVFETTVPHKAKLYIDDELKGETPLVEMLPMKNPVKVRFEAQGFAPKTIDLFPEREYKVTVLMDRAPLWRAAIDVENGAKLELEPVVWNGNMYLVSSYGEILVCSLEDGQLVESAALKDLSDAPENLHDVAADPTVSDGVMYLPSQDGFLYAINLDDLTLLWRFEVKDFLRSKPLVATHPLIGKKVIIFGTEEGKVYCVDDEGNQVWVASTGDSVTTHPVTDGESVFVTSTDSYAYKFSLEDGTRLARKATTAQIKGSPVLWGEMLCFGNDTGHFYVMRKSDLGILQCIPVARTPVTAPPIFVKGKVVLSSSPKPGNKGTANVIVLDSSTWGEVAALSLKGAISGSPVVAEGKLYVAFSSDVGKIHCYNIGEENGYSLQLHWKHNMTYRISARPLGHDGAVYVAAENGELIAFD